MLEVGQREAEAIISVGTPQACEELAMARQGLNLRTPLNVGAQFLHPGSDNGDVAHSKIAQYGPSALPIDGGRIRLNDERVAVFSEIGPDRLSAATIRAALRATHGRHHATADRRARPAGLLRSLPASSVYSRDPGRPLSV